MDGREGWRWARLLFAVALITLGAATKADARPGDIDRGFGNDGAVTATLVEDHPSFLLTAIMQDDLGRIIAGGVGTGGFLTRYRADGTLDPTFGAGAALWLPELPLATPATVEVRVDGGACWRMPLDAVTVRRNDDGRVRAQAPAPR